MRIAETSLKMGKFGWKPWVIAALASFYISIFFLVTSQSTFPDYGVDYFAWWSAGKTADTQGYSKIYDIDLLRNVQTEELKQLGMIRDNQEIHIIPNTAPLFSFFIVPFQFLSRMSSRTGYWIWTTLNFLLLIGYLLFFLKKIQPEKESQKRDILILLLLIASYAVFSNIGLGQVQVLLVICLGEFIRNASNKRPLVSGLWLGLLLLKFQLLIIIIPVLLLKRDWESLKGFGISCLVILSASLALSGISGMISLFNLLTNRYIGTATSNPDVMINWRMIGVNFNSWFGSPLGWIVAGIGIFLTLLAIYLLIRNRISIGSPEWIMVMVGVFSATIAVSWHSHYHLEMILIPFLLFASSRNLIKERMILFWVVMTPITWLIFLIVSLIASSSGIDISRYQGVVIGISGFIPNVILLSTAVGYTTLQRQAETTAS